MQSNQLRLGNWVKSDPYGDFPIVGLTAMPTNSTAFKSLEYYPQGTNCEDLYPIEITPEWLLKFGFKYYPCGSNSHLTYVCPNDTYYLQQDVRYTEWKILYKSDLEFIDFTLSFTHVHKLQNLYYLLTGEELTFHIQSEMNEEHDYFIAK